MRLSITVYSGTKQQNNFCSRFIRRLSICDLFNSCTSQLSVSLYVDWQQAGRSSDKSIMYI